MSDTPLPGTALDLPQPPDLDRTLGYSGHARYIGLSWSPAGDELVIDDGRLSASGQSWAFLAFKNHRAVAGLLRPFDLGSSEQDATHVLVIDRQAGRAAVAPITAAQTFLRDQWPPQPPLSPEQVEEVRQRIKAGWREVRVDPAAVRRAMDEQRQRLGRLMSWLDQCPGPTPGPERDGP